MSEKGVYRDMLGRVIYAGAWMVYPKTLGLSGSLMVVKVMELTGSTKIGAGGDPELHMKVQGVSQSYGGRLTAGSRWSTVRFPERGLLIDERHLPAALRDMVNAIPESTRKVKR